MEVKERTLRYTRKVQKLILFHLQTDKMYARRRFKKTFGYRLNLSEPKRMNEKLQWLKSSYYRRGRERQY